MVPLGHALKAGGGDDGEVGDIALQLLLGGPQQQLVDKQVLRGQLVDDAEGLGILGIGTGITVEDEDLPVLQIGHHLLIQGIKDLLGGGHIHLAPGDVVVHALGVNNKLVVGGAAGILSGGHAQRAGGAQLALAAAQGLLHQVGGGEVAVDSAGIDDPERFQTISFHNSSSLICCAKDGPHLLRSEPPDEVFQPFSLQIHFILWFILPYPGEKGKIQPCGKAPKITPGSDGFFSIFLQIREYPAAPPAHRRADRSR